MMNKFIIHTLILPLIFYLLLSSIADFLQIYLTRKSSILAILWRDSHLLSSICYAYPPGWSDDILINDDTTGNQGPPDVSTDSQNNVWITWDDATWTEGEIYYSKRDSLGNCLISETNVSNNASKSFDARVAVDISNNVQIIWRDASPQGYGIWYAKLANNGSVIVPSYLAVSGAGGLFSSLLPEMVLNRNQEVNIIWDEYPSGYNQMDYTKLDNLGDTIIPKIQVSPVGIFTCWPGIGVDSMMNCHLGYRSDSHTVDNLTYTKLDKDGTVLVDNKTLATGGLPTLISDRNQNIHVVYSDPTGPGIRIDYLKLDNDGNILIGPKTISPSQYSCTYLHMAIDSLQYLHIVWQADSFANVDIMYVKMDTAGNFVIPPMKVVDTGGEGTPRIAVDHSNRLHLVWASARLGTPDIFYKRGENDTGVEEIAQSKAVNLKLSVFPNPFTQMIDIRYEITDDRLQMTDNRIEIKIYDVTGRLVRSFLINQLTNSPINHIIWRGDGDDDFGRKVPAGVYFVHMTSSTATQAIPVVLLK